MAEIEKKTYTRKILFSTPAFEIVSCEWKKGSISALHGHGWSHCNVLVQSGNFENKLDFGFRLEISTYEAGKVISTPVGVNHEMKCLSDEGKTLHVYSPRIENSETSKVFSSHLENFQQDMSLQFNSIQWEELSKLLLKIESYSVTVNSPYFMNQLFSGIRPESLIAEEVINRTKATTATTEASPVFSMAEIEIVEALGKIVGWKKTQGVSTPGGSAANFMAIHCARHRFSPSIKHEGNGTNKFKIFVSTEAHYSFKKACVAMGLGLDSLVQIKVDADGKMIVSALENEIKLAKARGEVPIMVAATAGTTVLGSFDPIAEIAKICNKQKIWLHVDAAWGGAALFSSELKKLTEGIHLADSVTFDAHKFFGAPLTCGFFLTSDSTVLLEANDVSGADYLFHDVGENIDRGRLSWQCGRPPDAFTFWTIWKSNGTEGLTAAVEKQILNRNRLLDWISYQPRLKLIHSPEYFNVCVQIKPPNSTGDEFNWSKNVRRMLIEKNLAMVNFSTTAEGLTFLRLILCHQYLDNKHLEEILTWALEQN